MHFNQKFAHGTNIEDGMMAFFLLKKKVFLFILIPNLKETGR